MYVARTPSKTPLHKIVREHYTQVFSDKEKNGVTMPFHLEREFRKYLTCGILAHGMARFQCPVCQKEKFVAFSCKGRTLCPSCSGRRMADTAKHLVEEVIPPVSVRQWVLSMPYAHRFLLAKRPEFLRRALAIYHRAINQFYLKEARALKLKNPKVGAISVIQRFGGSLALNVHFHTIYMDGVFFENNAGGETFEEIIPSHEDIVKLTGILKSRLNRAMEKELDVWSDDDESLSLIQSTSVQNRDENFRAPIQVGKSCDPPFQEFKGTRCCYDNGFSLHAKVKILGSLRDSLEHLCRYVMRGPIANERVSYEETGQVRLKLKTPYSDGTTHLEFTPEQFIKRIIALIPPPRQNMIRYVGVFGARHKKRAEITAKAMSKKDKTKKKKIYRTPWAELLKHVFRYEVELCDHCGTKLKLVACIVSTLACRKILAHLDLPIDEVQANAPRAPPENDFFDQTTENF
jgi:hypothetical protein